MKIARIYERVSTSEQDLTRQAALESMARDNGFYIAGIYKEKASGAWANRPELLRMIADLQPGDVVIAEKIDRISRLPLPEAEKLITSIRKKGARLSIPGIVDLADLAADSAGVSRIVLESVQELLLKLALQTARDDYELYSVLGSAKASSSLKLRVNILAEKPIQLLTSALLRFVNQV